MGMRVNRKDKWMITGQVGRVTLERWVDGWQLDGHVIGKTGGGWMDGIGIGMQEHSEMDGWMMARLYGATLERWMVDSQTGMQVGKPGCG